MEGRNWHSFGITKLLGSKSVACLQQQSQFDLAIPHKYQLFQQGNCRCDLLRFRASKQNGRGKRQFEKQGDGDAQVAGVGNNLPCNAAQILGGSTVQQPQGPFQCTRAYSMFQASCERGRNNLSFDSNEYLRL